MLKVQFSAIIDGVNAKKDKTLSIRLGTQEMSTDDSAHLFDLMGKQIYVGFAETGIEAMEVPEVLPEMHGEKTPAQRLRGILFKIWEQKRERQDEDLKSYSSNDGYMTFPKFYDDYMFKLCERLKEKLQ